MLASQMEQLAQRAGVGPGTSLLDVCCGVAGPGRFLTRAFRCRYLGVDSSPSAIGIARELAADLPCRFEVAHVPPLPPGRFDVVMLLETILAFPDKAPLVAAVAAALPPGGRFAFTLEEGAPLTASERAAMPGGETVWPTPLEEMDELLAAAGLAVRWCEEHTASHRATADALADAFEEDGAAIAASIGRRALDDLVTSHRRWSAWFAAGRARKFAIVAEEAG
jgi:SAM-dependent methyltransferase